MDKQYKNLLKDILDNGGKKSDRTGTGTFSVFGRFIRKLSKQAQDESAKSNATIEESLMGISNVKSFTNEVFMLNKYKKAINTIKALQIRSGLWRGVFASFIIFCLFGAIVFIIWQGLLMTQGSNPELAEKDFFSFIML